MPDYKKIYLLPLFLLLIVSCKDKKTIPGGLHFSLLDAAATNIHFSNAITESDDVNVYKNEYMYNGSGVGTGDFNNDGLPDLFFCGSMETSRLYINKGNFRFEDITASAGVTTSRWCTGVSITDINGDGFSDIYVTASHSRDKDKRKNLLFINDGKLHFSEQAAGYGLADTGYSSQAAFLDYDKDGDLDMYLLNHRLYNRNPNNLVPKDTSGHSPAQDRLYRNEGVPAGSTHPIFSDISMEAGIREDGYGLGIVITDADNDNWPDIYIANDYLGNDLLWRNNKNGSFTNIIASSIRHQSFNSMGVDAADINNDGLPELAVLDMSPETNERKKMMFNGSSQERYDMERRLGYEPGFVRNMLQLNNGLRNINGRQEPFYSEIGQLAGISETDWSWSVLMADFDNDGWKDMHITNGLARDVTNNDYVSFKNSQYQSGYTFSGQKSTKAEADEKTIRLLRENLDLYGSIKVSNYFFRNNGDLSFVNSTKEAGLALPSISNGALYADLDNDGDLDMVVNNMDQPAFVWKNETRATALDTLNNFISIKLKGPAGNSSGLGAKLSLYNKGAMQYLEQAPARGFSSVVDERLHFGLGNASVIDSIKIQWPDNKEQLLLALRSNQLLNISYSDAKLPGTAIQQSYAPSLFNDASKQPGISFKHSEGQFFDFGSQRGLPQKFSQLGPCIAKADINADGLIDFFIGGAAGQPGKLFTQEKKGGFTGKDISALPKQEEDIGAVFLDADTDGDPDLLVTGGSQEFGSSIILNQPRLYINNGKGNFTRDSTALPEMTSGITGSLAIADWDEDGDMDVFIAGRVLPQKYPQSPRSYLLRNDKGKFKDVTKEICPLLEFPGLITGAVFADFNNDKAPDLVINGEWMPVRFFANERGKWKEVTDKTCLQNMSGQWRSLQAGDIDRDGDIDFIAGNLGKNNKFHISNDRPMKLFAADFDNNNFRDIIPAYYIMTDKGAYDLFPALDRNQLADQIPSVKKKYLLHSQYAGISMRQLLENLPAKDLIEKDCETTASGWIENLGGGQFQFHALPVQAQLAPVNAILVADLDEDGNMDLLLAGNEYQTEVSTGRYDASYGLFLKGNGIGGFIPVSPAQSGFIADGDVKALALINLPAKKLILAAINDQELKYYLVNSNHQKQ